MIPPEVERGEYIAAAEAIGWTVKGGSNEGKNTQLSAPDPEAASVETNEFAGSQDSLESTIDPTPIPLPDEPIAIGRIVSGEIEAALTRLEKEISREIMEGHTLNSIIEHMIPVGSPLPENQIREIVEVQWAWEQVRESGGLAETTDTPVPDEIPETPSDETDLISGSQDDHTSSIAPVVTPPDDRTEPDDPTGIGNDDPISDMGCVDAEAKQDLIRQAVGACITRWNNELIWRSFLEAEVMRQRAGVETASGFYPGIKAQEEDRPPTPPKLTEDQVCQIELIQGKIRDIMASGDPDKICHLEDLVREYNQSFTVPFTDEEALDILNQERSESAAHLERSIVVNGRQLGELTEVAINALEKWNENPHLFRRDQKIVRISGDKKGRPIIEEADEFTIRWALDKCACWYMTQGKNPIKIPTIPPLHLIRNVIREPSLELPTLLGTIEVPTLRRDGSIITEPGYDEKTGLYYSPAPNQTIPEIPDDPTPLDQIEAVKLILEIFHDFPFVDDASRANMIAALLSPIVRPLIPGAVPMFLFDKPKAGTGASLLAEVVSIVTTGRNAPMMAAPSRDEEWSKKIATIVIEGRSIAVWDNVVAPLKSADLALVITSLIYDERVLGRNKSVSLPHRTVWMASGNNLQLGGDIPRRCVHIRMNAGAAHPEEREGFLHQNLTEWIAENRGLIVAAILTMCRAWVRAKGPLPTGIPVMGNFEQWRNVIGGILQFNGISGFLGNVETMRETIDTESPEWELFFERWYEIWADAPRTVPAIVKYLNSTDDLNRPQDQQLKDVLPDSIEEVWGRDSAVNRRLGHELSRQKDVVFSTGYVLEKGVKQAHGYAGWIVKKIVPVQKG